MTSKEKKLRRPRVNRLYENKTESAFTLVTL